MSDSCYAATRTNYFHVKDEEEYARLFDRLEGDEDVIDLSETDKNGICEHCFGSYGYIAYCPDEESSGDMMPFFRALQKILPEDEAFIMIEAGWQDGMGIGYYGVPEGVGADATVVTANDIRTLSVEDASIRLAREMLNNPDYNTYL